jgi:hypothetical protein
MGSRSENLRVFQIVRREVSRIERLAPAITESVEFQERSYFAEHPVLVVNLIS